MIIRLVARYNGEREKPPFDQLRPARGKCHPQPSLPIWSGGTAAEGGVDV